MFHFDRGLKITKIDLGVDMRRRQVRGFISHAHADHMAPHELAFCTSVTGALYRHRHGAKRLIREMQFHQTLNWEGAKLTCHPAGHVFGSAMLHVDVEGETLLYTGDFKLGDSATAEKCEPPHADILVMECTFGDPKYRLPPRAQVVRDLVDVVASAIERSRTPVIHAYVLGKAQEVSKLLTDAGIPVLQHTFAWEISEIYRAYGCKLGDCKLYPGEPLPGHVVIAPPQSQKGYHLPNLKNTTTIAVTGWAIDPETASRWGVDHAIPLSDHADFDELLEIVERVKPKKIYCTHGRASFSEILKSRGLNATHLDG
jgi:putative mRNA 3-end processing factor